MNGSSFFFAGGGTGGHIYPAIAIAEQLIKLEPKAKIHFFISGRNIDSQILSKTNFEVIQLPARGFSACPGRLINFCRYFMKSCRIAKRTISAANKPIVIGIGGFVAAPVCLAAYKLNVPIVLINVDTVPGRANKIIARWAKEIFVQFEETAQYFTKTKADVSITGCPLRSGFDNPQPDRIVEQLALDKNKKILLITGASSGAESINNTICSLLGKLTEFSDSWQIIHLAGLNNYEKVSKSYINSKISYKVLAYCDNMADLLSATDLVIGRAGAVSVAEYAAASTTIICMPYPYHKDRHQYLNADKLVKAGAAVIVDDLPDVKERARLLWEKLEQLLKDDERRQQMVKGCEVIARKEAACKIAEKLVKTAVNK